MEDQKPPDPETDLFQGASDRAQQLFKEAKRVRRLTERRNWWQQNKDKPTEPNES